MNLETIFAGHSMELVGEVPDGTINMSGATVTAHFGKCMTQCLLTKVCSVNDKQFRLNLEPGDTSGWSGTYVMQISVTQADGKKFLIVDQHVTVKSTFA